MAHFRPVEQHIVFPVVRKGDTLIVIPAGDAASFTSAELHGEHHQLLKLFEDRGLKNLIVDLGGSNYFGSEIIGTINHLFNHVRDRGGRFAVCAASPDMREGLHIMKLDTVWPMYGTRRQAERAIIITQSLAERLRANPAWVAALLVVAALVAFVLVWLLRR